MNIFIGSYNAGHNLTKSIAYSPWLVQPQLKDLSGNHLFEQFEHGYSAVVLFLGL